jgi:hypothetical protein
MAGRVLILSLFVVLLTAVVGGCSAGKPSSAAGPASYDVNAARLCQVFDMFVVDAKNGSDDTIVSSQLDADRQKLQANAGPHGKWNPMLKGITAFLQAAAAGNGHDVDFIGLEIGGDCNLIPPAAKKAGGYSG